jgi:hypothetical protein
MSKKSLLESRGYSSYCKEGEHETGTHLAFTNDLVLTLTTTRHLHDMLQRAHTTLKRLTTREDRWEWSESWHGYTERKKKGSLISRLLEAFWEQWEGEWAQWIEDFDYVKERAYNTKDENRAMLLDISKDLDRLMDEYGMKMDRIRSYQGISHLGGTHVQTFCGHDDSHIHKLAERLYNAACAEMRECGCDFDTNDDEATLDRDEDRRYDFYSWLVREHLALVRFELESELRKRMAVRTQPPVPLVIDAAFAN